MLSLCSMVYFNTFKEGKNTSTLYPLVLHRILFSFTALRVKEKRKLLCLIVNLLEMVKTTGLAIRLITYFLVETPILNNFW